VLPPAGVAGGIEHRAVTAAIVGDTAQRTISGGAFDRIAQHDRVVVHSCIELDQ
jgi:hypothetical protein